MRRFFFLFMITKGDCITIIPSWLFDLMFLPFHPSIYPFPSPFPFPSPSPLSLHLNVKCPKECYKGSITVRARQLALTQSLGKSGKIPCVVFLTYRHICIRLFFFFFFLSFRIKAYCVFRDCGLPYWLFSTSYLQSGGAMVFFFVNSSVLSLSAGGVWSKR